MTLQLALPNGASVDLPSRVGDIEAGDAILRVVVVRPDLSGLAEPGTFPREGEELRLLWAQPACQMQMRVAAVAANRPYGPVWVLTPVGAATREQRREFFRIPLTVPAELTPVVGRVGDLKPVTPATLTEVGEGGALITCDAGLPEVGTFVELSFTLHDKTVTAKAEVLRHIASPTGQASAALRFVDPAAYGDHIRQVAFALQRTRARTGLG